MPESLRQYLQGRIGGSYLEEAERVDSRMKGTLPDRQIEMLGSRKDCFSIEKDIPIFFIRGRLVDAIQDYYASNGYELATFMESPPAGMGFGFVKDGHAESVALMDFSNSGINKVLVNVYEHR
ncbi:MAG: hypothetical protein HY518_05805 [Candidatus Aenigmarchaeota archaeon]|nr:hypothetical protein [Candidatus Aenigmarchaeota archaeon]